MINKELKLSKLKSKIIKVNTKIKNNFFINIKNKYFQNETIRENLFFVYEISKKLNLNKKLFVDTIENFKGLKYRQQIIYNKSKLTIINDSKSTSFSSSVGVLKINSNIYWLLGGIPKKGDKFTLPKKYLNKTKAFIYGKNYSFFNKQLKNKIRIENFKNLKIALSRIFALTKHEKIIDKTILFSPCAASFDTFKNFEDRGSYFNKLVKDYFHAK